MNDIFTPADVLLPKEGTDMTRWAVVACDQFSAQPEYWEELDAFVGDAPSALRLMLPEAYLNAPDLEARKATMNEKMNEYLVGGVFSEIKDSYISRNSGKGKKRNFLYDFSAFFAEERKKKKHYHAAVQKTENDIFKVVFPLPKIFVRGFKDFFAGKKFVYGNRKIF